MKARNILETIGNTPHVRVNRLFANRKVEVWMKLSGLTLVVASRIALD